MENNNMDMNNNGANTAKKPLSMWSMICGIAPYIVMWIPGLAVLSLPSAITAIVLACVAKGKEGKNGMRTAGLVLGIVSVSLTVLGFILLLLGAAMFLGAF